MLCSLELSGNKFRPYVQLSILGLIKTTQQEILRALRRADHPRLAARGPRAALHHRDAVRAGVHLDERVRRGAAGHGCQSRNQVGWVGFVQLCCGSGIGVVSCLRCFSAHSLCVMITAYLHLVN